MTTAVVVASVTAFWGLIVWFVKLILLERYQFMDKIGGEPIKGPYVMIRLDRLTGAVDAFNWAGWVRVAPHSGYPGTETPGKGRSLRRQVAIIGGGIILLCALIVGGVFAWQKYESRQAARQEARQQAEQKAACVASAKLATTESFIPDLSVCDNNSHYRWPPACKNGLMAGCIDDSFQPWKKYGPQPAQTQAYEFNGKRYEVPKDTTLEELDAAIKEVSKDADYAKASPEDQKGYLAYVIDTSRKKKWSLVQ
jgi:hypothetical protein